MDPKTEDWAAKIAEAVKKGVAEALNSAGLSAPGTSKVGGAEPSTPSTMGPSPATRHPRGQMLRSVPYNKDDTKSKFPEGKKQDIMPISDLRPGMTGFTLQGRVISKSPVAFYRGKVGRLFSVEIIDVKGFVTRLTFYDKVADKCIILLDVSGVYTFKGGKTTKPSKKYNPNAIVEVKFINENAQDIEIKQMDDDRSIPSSPTHQFRSIQDARKMTAGSLVDVCGILLECSELETVHISKTNEKKQKRNFTIIDYSDVVQETAWDERAADCIVTPDITEKNAVITLKQARVVEFNEQTLTVGPHTLIQVNPNIPEAEKTRQWWCQQHRTPLQCECHGSHEQHLKEEVVDFETRIVIERFFPSVNIVESDNPEGHRKMFADYTDTSPPR